MNETLVKVFMISYFLLYYGILFVLNSFLVFKRTGKNPYVLGQSKGVIRYVEKSIKTIGIIIPVIVSVYTFSHTAYQWFIPMQYLESIYFEYTGIAIMILGFIVCLIAQYYMRSSWKIGIGLNAEVKLVEDGIFRYSRNPFFLGSLLSYAGLFFVLPNIISFTVGIIYYFLIQIQVRLEEEYLVKSLGNKYQNYCSDVRRWL
jgi:protein-S-isoprenylcysteine O-methyltransferase Ste14